VIRWLRLYAAYPLTYTAVTLMELGEAITYYGRQLDRYCYRVEGLQPPTLDTDNTEPLHEWNCPACGATTRARMADHPSNNPTTDLTDHPQSCEPHGQLLG
jgi:hypothetical protein